MKEKIDEAMASAATIYSILEKMKGKSKITLSLLLCKAYEQIDLLLLALDSLKGEELRGPKNDFHLEISKEGGKIVIKMPLITKAASLSSSPYFLEGLSDALKRADVSNFRKCIPFEFSFLFVYPKGSKMHDLDNHNLKPVIDLTCSVLSASDSPMAVKRIVLEAAYDDFALSPLTILTISKA